MYIKTELCRKKWHNFIYNNARGNIFQTSEIYDTYLNTKNYEPVFVAAVDNKNKILGTLLAVIQKESSGLFGYLSARAIIWGGPIVRDNNLEVLSFLLAHYNEYVKKKAIYSQFRNLWEWSKSEQSVFYHHGYCYEDHLDIIHTLNKSDNEFLEKMNQGRRKNIRRSLMQEVKVDVINTEKELHSALAIIKETYLKAKIPMPDFSLFISAFRQMSAMDLVKFFKATADNQIIGVRSVLCYKDLVYDWYAGSISAASDKYPNDLLPFKIMTWGRDNNYKFFQFGGAGKPNLPYGVRDYKLRFGGDLVNWGRYEKINRPLLMKTGKIGYKLLQKIRDVKKNI